MFMCIDDAERCASMHAVYLPRKLARTFRPLHVTAAKQISLHIVEMQRRASGGPAAVQQADAAFVLHASALAL